jgi:hypothetical protein
MNVALIGANVGTTPQSFSVGDVRGRCAKAAKGLACCPRVRLTTAAGALFHANRELIITVIPYGAHICIGSRRLVWGVGVARRVE